MSCSLQIIDLHRDTVPSWLRWSRSVNVTKFIRQRSVCRDGAVHSSDFEEDWDGGTWRMVLSDGANSFEAWSLDYHFNKMIEDIKVEV